MAKKELVKIERFDSEQGKVFVLSQSIKGLDEYSKAKAITKFKNSETKVLETSIETYLRQVLRENGINIQDGSESALNRAFCELDIKGKSIAIIDRYYEIENENTIGMSNNGMTIILEDDILSCAMEVVVNE